MTRHSWHDPVKSPGQRDYFLRKKYKIDTEQYYTLLVRQDGVCAICGNPEPSGKALSVDHDHDTEIVRGLLCTSCNLGLGHFKTIKNLVGAIAYLEDIRESS